MKIFCLGEMVIDFTPGAEKNSYIKNPGGAVANVAIALKRLGVDSVFCGKLGNDDFGLFLERVLEENGVEIACREKTDRAITTLAFVNLYEDGNRTFTFARKPGADMLLSKKDIKVSAIKNADYIHAGCCSMSEGPARKATEYALELGHKLGKIVSFDVNYRNLQWKSPEACSEQMKKVLPFVDLLKVSDEEIFLFGGEKAIPKLMQKYSVSLVAVTCGEKPAKVFWNGESIECSVPRVKAVDTTGAGDSFWAAFLAQLIKNGIADLNRLNRNVLEDALSWATAAGSMTVMKYGAIPALPSLEELELFKANTEKGRERIE